MQCIRSIPSLAPSLARDSTLRIKRRVGVARVLPLRTPIMASKVEYVTAADLAKTKGDKIAIVDVRDEERKSGGHIAGSLHYASENFEARVVELLHDVQGKDAVIFHCAQSRVRGPTCARSFADHINRAQAAGTASHLPKVLVLEHGFNGWAASGQKVCNCKDNPCKCK